jgi:hypothetical protein
MLPSCGMNIARTRSWLDVVSKALDSFIFFFFWSFGGIFGELDLPEDGGLMLLFASVRDAS